MDLPRDVKPGLLAGGLPPPEGWPGGEPARNGWKPVSARK